MLFSTGDTLCKTHLYFLVYIQDISNVAKNSFHIFITQYGATPQCRTLQWLLEHLLYKQTLQLQIMCLSAHVFVIEIKTIVNYGLFL